jgi:hypothetical protein
VTIFLFSSQGPEPPFSEQTAEKTPIVACLAVTKERVLPMLTNQAYSVHVTIPFLFSYFNSISSSITYLLLVYFLGITRLFLFFSLFFYCFHSFIICPFLFFSSFLHSPLYLFLSFHLYFSSFVFTHSFYFSTSLLSSYVPFISFLSIFLSYSP